MRKIIIIVAMVVGIFNLYGDTLKNANQSIQIIDSAIQKITDEKFQDGINILKKYCIFSSIQMDSIGVEMQKQWPLIKENYGNKVGTEYIKTESIGKSFARVIMLAKYDRFALVFYTILYNSKDGWIIVDFTFNDKVRDLFE